MLKEISFENLKMMFCKIPILKPSNRKENLLLASSNANKVFSLMFSCLQIKFQCKF